MSDNNTEKRRGRPYKGVDGQRITVRISNEQASTLAKYCQEYGFVTKTDGTANYSDAIRELIDNLSDRQKSQEFFDNVIMDNLIDISNYLAGWSESYRKDAVERGEFKEGEIGYNMAHDFARDASALLFIAFTLNRKFSYEDNRVDVKQKKYDFTRHPKMIDKKLGLYFDDFNKYAVEKSERKYDTYDEMLRRKSE